MRIYTVHELSNAPIDSKGLVFVREGFSWLAFLLPALWLAFKCQWIALAAYIGLGYIMLILATTFNFDKNTVAIILLALHIYFGLSANDIYRWILDCRGYRDIGITNGHTLIEAECNFLRFWCDLPKSHVNSSIEITGATISNQ
jgi:hypothetical protein